jgi:hypothetical protein
MSAPSPIHKDVLSTSVRRGHERVVDREERALLDSPAVLFVSQPSCASEVLTAVWVIV